MPQHKKSAEIKRPGSAEEPGKKPTTLEATRPTDPSDFPIVAIGASAGGLEAIKAFFRNMPPDSGAAFVVVQHLAPDFKSMMAEIIRQSTSMTTRQVTDGARVEPDTIYTMQPGRDLLIEDRVLRLAEPQISKGQRLPIDRFFTSLAQDQAGNAICVLLSGTGSDGSLSLKEVKELGGFAIAQNEDAGFQDMPRYAISTGMVDYVLAVEDMPGKILELIRTRPSVPTIAGDAPAAEAKDEQFRKIFRLLKLRTGYDFSLYKHNTIARRIQRRMVLLKAVRLKDYAEHLKDNPAEVHALFKELLIGVTSFFRDADCFEALGKDVIPRMFADKPDAGTVRIWVVGCSTGEEAYSIAMLVSEYMGGTSRMNRVQIFATDIDEASLNTARNGVYSESIQADVSEERLSRFFSKQEGNYKINKDIRDMCVFATHSLIKDPPYSRIDLISCRNLLIYLSTELQAKFLSLFNYALNPNGFLFLGPSESVTGNSDFTVVDRKAKIFQRKGSLAGKMAAIPILTVGGGHPARSMPGPQSADHGAVADKVAKILLEQFVAPSVVVNEQYEALQFFGPVGAYFKVTAGVSTKSVLHLAREDLRLHLRTALHAAMREGRAVRRNGLTLQLEETLHKINLLVTPLKEDEKGGRLFLVVFEQARIEKPLPEEGETFLPSDESSVAASLEQELRETKEQLQTTIEEVESSNEELKSSNEELMSMNEEMQSTNEELETSREELHSINEELTTVNAELQAKVDELELAYNDLKNFLNSTRIATLFLDMKSIIRRFTPQTTEYFNILETDVGRPFGHLRPKIDYPEVFDDIRQVLDDLMPVERQIPAEGGSWIMVRILPYRATHNEVAGLIITLVDVTRMRFAEQRMAEMTVELEAVYRATPDIYIRVGKDNTILGLRCWGEPVLVASPKAMIGRKLEDIFPSAAGESLEAAIVEAREKAAQRSVDITFSEKGTERFLEARILPVQDEVYVIMRDMTELRKAETRIKFQADALAQVSDALVAVDNNDVVILWNEGAERILGIAARDVMGKRVEEVTGSRWLLEADPAALDAAPSGDRRHWVRELEAQRPDGGKIMVESSTSVIRDRQGEKIGLLTVLWDISERKRFESELLQAKEAAEAADLAKSEFLANMSHEIRTPMNGILGMTHLALMTCEDAKSREFLLLAKQSGESLLSIINDILDISKIEAGKVELRDDDFALRDFLELLIESFEPMTREKGTTLVLAVDPGVPDILTGDSGRLRQVLSNLLDNAAKFTRNGQVELSVKCADESASCAEKARLRFTIRDTGIGIPRDQLKSIFESFSQAHASAHPEFGGTGLGLTISKGLVMMMGGEISVESEVGKGSTFSFTAAFGLGGTLSQPGKVQAAGASPSGSLRILLAEDNMINRHLAVQLLTLRGHQVETAENGHEAIEMIRAGNFDLAIMDVRMPIMDGSMAVRAIRSGAAGQDKAGIKVVAMTAYALKGDRERFLADGMDDYIAKPIDMDELDRVLSRIMAQPDK